MVSFMRKQLAGLRRELKDFAFEQSPSFQNGFVAGMEVVKRSYFDEPSLPEGLSPVVEPDLIIVQMGFKAIRLSGGYGGKPIYVFSLTSETSQTISSRSLPDSLLDDMVLEYLDDEEGEERDSTDALSDRRREELHDSFTEDGIECYRYMGISLEISDFEKAIEEIYTRGYCVNGNIIEEMSTADTIYDADQVVVDSPERERIDDPDVMMSIDFLDLIEASGINSRETTDLLPTEEKIDRCRFIMHTLRTGDLR